VGSGYLFNIFPAASPQLFVSNSGRYIFYALANTRRSGDDINGWFLYDVVERRIKWKNTQLPFGVGVYGVKAYFSPDDRYIMCNTKGIIDVEKGEVVGVLGEKLTFPFSFPIYIPALLMIGDTL